MRKNLTSIIGGHFFKNFSILFTGTLISQVITILTSVIIARIYDPESIGTYTLATSFIIVIGNVATFKYDLAIVLSKKNLTTLTLTAISVILSILIGVLFFICASLFNYFYFEIYQINYVVLISFGIIFTGVSLSLKGYFVRHKEFKRLSLANIYRSSSMSLVQLSGYLIATIPSILILGKIVGEVLGSVLSKNFSVVYNDIKKNFHFNIRYIKRTAFSFKDFPIYNAPKSLINSLSQNAIIFILSIFSGSIVVGYYGMANRILQLPVNFIVQAVSQVYYQKASETVNKNGKSLKLYSIITLALGLVGIIPFSILYLYGTELFSFFLGENWGEAGKYAEWLAIWMFFAFLNSPSINMLQIFRKQNILLIYEVINFSVRILILIYGVSYLSDLNTIKYFSLAGALMNLLLIVLVLIIVINKELKSEKQ